MQWIEVNKNLDSRIPPLRIYSWNYYPEYLHLKVHQNLLLVKHLKSWWTQCRTGS